MTYPAADTPRRVLLLDFWSDRNRGDAAMQIAFLRLLRDELPGVHLSVMTAYGLNQWPDPIGELDESGPLADEIVGGFEPTSVEFASPSRPKERWRSRSEKAWAALQGLILLPVWILLARISWCDPLLPRQARRSVRALRSANLVIWNGRNFRSDATWREPYDIWQLLYNPIIACAFGKPIASVGASIWPLRNPFSKVLLRAVLRRTYFMSLREQGSYDRASDLLRGTATVTRLLPDLSLAVLPHDGGDPRADSTPHRIAVTLVDSVKLGSAARDTYTSAVRAYLEDMLAADDRAEVIVVPQVTYEARRLDALTLAVIGGLDENRVTTIDGRPTVEELIDIYSHIDLLLATRMHSAIFALTQGVPTVTIPYDAGGKWGILDMIGAGNLDVPYSDITPSRLASKVDEVWAKRDDLRASIAARAPKLANDVRDNIRIPVAMYVDMVHDGRRASP